MGWAWAWAWAWATTIMTTTKPTELKALGATMRLPLPSFLTQLAANIGSPIGVVFVGGVNLILIQWVLVREMTALLLGTELVVLLVSIAYFAGLTLGYQLSGRINVRWIAPLGIATLVLHLTLPIWFRLLVAWLSSIQAYGIAFLVLPLLTPFVVSAFYSLFLPLYADQGKGNVANLYGVEVLGSVVGVLVLVLLAGFGFSAVFLVYGIGLLFILGTLGVSLDKLLVMVLGIGIWLALFPMLNQWSNALWYQSVHGLPSGTTTLYTGYSAYQKIDVLQSSSGSRYLYLDGMNHFGTYDGQRLNVVSGQVPSMLIRPQNALVLGAGSMQMAAMIADYAKHVHTVEVDPLVVEVSLRYFGEYNRMNKLTNRSITVDDAKHYIANSTETYDLIATDLPAAYSIQTATLYSAPFFASIAEHLTPKGVFVANLTSEFELDDLVSRRIAAGLLANFDEVMVITPRSVGWSFAYASDDLPFDRETVEQALRDSGEQEFVIYETEAVQAFVGTAQPITLDSMDIVLHVSWDWMSDRMTQ